MKTQAKESVLKDWVQELPFMQQAVLCSAMRGPDGVAKDTYAKCVLRYMRSVVLNAAGDYEGNCDSFMWKQWEAFENFAINFFQDTDFLPMHWLMHFFHAAEIIGYNHPDEEMQARWYKFYMAACYALHLNPETKEELNNRLNA